MCSPRCICFSFTSQHFPMQAHEGMDALVFNLRQEHVVICDFVSTFHQVCLPPRLPHETS
jgi:hypothetical protein